MMDLRKLLLKMYTLYKFDGKEFVIVHILVKTLYWTASRVMAIYRDAPHPNRQSRLR